VVVITRSGYIKRMPVEEFEAQVRGGKGKAGVRLSGDMDQVHHFFTCNDHDTLIFTTDRYVIVVGSFV
jgi:DNA gyrase subunit A